MTSSAGTGDPDGVADERLVVVDGGDDLDALIDAAIRQDHGIRPLVLATRRSTCRMSLSR